MKIPDRLHPMALPAALVAVLFLCAILLNLHALGWLRPEGAGMHLVVDVGTPPPASSGLAGSPYQGADEEPR